MHKYATLPPSGSQRLVHYTLLVSLFLSVMSDVYTTGRYECLRIPSIWYAMVHGVAAKHPTIISVAWLTWLIFCCILRILYCRILNSLILLKTFQKMYDILCPGYCWLLSVAAHRVITHPSQNVYGQLRVEQDWFDLIPCQHAPHRREAFEDGIEFHLLICLQITQTHISLWARAFQGNWLRCLRT